MSIELAPPVVAGNAYFWPAGSKPGVFAYILAGYTVLIVLFQLRQLPLYLKLSFTPALSALLQGTFLPMNQESL